jgi:hypothetical protein
MNVPSLNLHIYANTDDLPFDLQCYVESVPGSSMQVFKHPLWTDIIPIATPVPIEDIILSKLAACDQLLDAGDESGFVFLHERAFRMDVLNDLWASGTFDNMPERYWKLARKVWIDSEQDEGDLRWSRLLDVPLPQRSCMSTDEEWQALSKQPETLTLYRGLHGYDQDDARRSCANGWSWTLSPKTAHFFARRLRDKSQQGFIATAQAPRSAVIAHFLSRGESEIVISSDDIDQNSICIEEL